MSPQHPAWLASLAVVGLSSGCTIFGDKRTVQIAELERENARLQEQTQTLQQRIAHLQRSARQKDEQIDALLRRGDAEVDKLNLVTRIEIERLSGGFDVDRKPGDEGVVVYLRPLDQDGHAVKAAGQARIELLDLANPDGQHLLGVYELTIDELRRAWYGRLMTHHYTIRCPWRTAPPRHEKITIRAAFIDYLTCRTLEAVHTCEVELPSGPPGEVAKP